MRGAGYYADRLMWMVQSPSAQTETGDIPETFTDSGYLWCRREEPKGADKIMWGSLQTAVDTKVTFRGNPGVRSVDRLRDSAGQVYVILGVALDTDRIDQTAMCVMLPGGAP